MLPGDHVANSESTEAFDLCQSPVHGINLSLILQSPQAM